MATVVVGAAIIRDGAVLAARRSAPPATAGKWEFPGGKVEPGESDREALVRECREELGVAVEPGEALGPPVTVVPGLVLKIYKADLVEGEPAPLEDHDLLRWVPLAEVAALDWLPADRPAVQRLSKVR